MLQSIESFNHPQSLQQTNDENWLLINLSGLEYADGRMPSGSKIQLGDFRKPFALFLPARGHFDFIYGKNRHNWVLKLAHNSLKEHSSGDVILRSDHQQIIIPSQHEFSTLQAERARNSLKRLHLAFHRPHKNREFFLRLSLDALLDIILNPDLESNQTDPAELFRQRIVEDRSFSKTLSTLSHEIGFSSDHLRRLFEHQFGITPKVFREQYRMDIALSYLSNGMTAKSVSEELGYSYPGHFSNAFKKFYGRSPSSKVT